MVDLGELVVYALLFIPVAYSGNLSLKSLNLYYKLCLREYYERGNIANSESVVVEGTVTVDEPAYAADRTVENAGSVVGAYLWRATFPTMLNSIDFENRKIKEHQSTYKSGMESGKFSVRDGRNVRIDFSWLLENHNATRLSELSVSSTRTPRKFRAHLWNSPFVHISSAKTARTVEQVADIIAGHGKIPASEHYIESKPILDGTTVAVCGNVRIENGTPVLYGTDARPLAISDQGVAGLRKKLRFCIVKHAFSSLLWLGFIAVLWIHS